MVGNRFLREADMTRDDFYNQLIEIIGRFEYDHIEVEVSDEIFSLGKHGIAGVITTFHSVFITGELPNSVFTVPGGTVLYELKEEKGSLVFRLAVE